jgi:hypothetical protein
MGLQTLLRHRQVLLLPRTLARCRRLQGGIRKLKVYTDDSIRYGNLAASSEPFNLQEALSVSHW